MIGKRNRSFTVSKPQILSYVLQGETPNLRSSKRFSKPMIKPSKAFNYQDLTPPD
jgi:hypothetical protein